MKQIYANNCTTLPLGRHGENLARKVAFDLSDWVSEYGAGTAELIYQRPGDAAPYPVAAVRDGDTLVWTLTATDTDCQTNYGRCELRYYVGETLAKSKTWRTWVEPAMDTPSGTAPPYPERGWVDQVVAAGAEAKQAAARAENAVVHAPIIGDNGNWFVWDSTTAEYIDTGRYSGGSAPYIGANGNWFIGTTDSGVSATGPAGPAGADGKPGRDGVDGLPGEKGEPFRYEDFTKEQLEALRGPEGPAGQPGRDGIDGKDGQDGYTPQKGIDYFDGEPGQPGEKGDPFTYADFTPEQLEALRGPQGIPGPAGSIDNLTAESIKSALGYTPADSADLADKLPKSPTDWEPWTADEKAAAHQKIGLSNYELVLDYTITEADENTDSVYIHFEKNDYTKIYVIFDESGIAGTTYFSVRFGVLDQSQLHNTRMLGVTNAAFQTNRKWKTYEGEVIKGLGLIYQATSEFQLNGYVSTPSVGRVQSESISGIGGITWYGKIYAGTNIKVWGFR